MTILLLKSTDGIYSLSLFADRDNSLWWGDILNQALQEHWRKQHYAGDFGFDGASVIGWIRHLQAMSVVSQCIGALSTFAFLQL